MTSLSGPSMGSFLSFSKVSNQPNMQLDTPAPKQVSDHSLYAQLHEWLRFQIEHNTESESAAASHSRVTRLESASELCGAEWRPKIK